MKIVHSYNGMSFIVNVPYKGFPQDGQRAVAMLDNEVKKSYISWKERFIDDCRDSLGNVYDLYIKNCHNYPKDISTLFICADIQKGILDEKLDEKEFDINTLMFNISWAYNVIRYIYLKIKKMEERLNDLQT